MNGYHSAQFPPCINQICDEPYADWGQDKDSCLSARQGRECAAEEGKKRTNGLLKKGRRGGLPYQEGNQSRLGRVLRMAPLYASTADQDDEEEAG